MVLATLLASARHLSYFFSFLFVACIHDVSVVVEVERN
jgi:hypothetical protein